MTEHEITYRIYPPGRVHTEIERDPEEYPYPPDVRIAWAERKEYSNIDLSYDDLSVAIESCVVEIVHGETEYGQCFRAYRITKIEGLRAIEYASNHYPIFLTPNNMIRGTLIVDDGRDWWRYIIDKWYDCDKTRDHDIGYDDPPDLVPALALLFKPYLRDPDM